MIFNNEDIVRYNGDVEIPQLGGGVKKGKSSVTMHKPTGIVIIAQVFDGGNFDRFIVGALNATGDIEEKREYAEKTEKDFFDAVAYFEELIKQRQPEEEKQSPPAVGKFYYFKPNLSRDSYVEISGIAPVVISPADVLVVFSPPRTKPFGRLNMLDDSVANKPEYETIKAKFALKYDKLSCDALADKDNLDKKDFAIYDMTPYDDGGEGGEGGEGAGEPIEIEDEPVKPTDDLEKKKPEPKNKPKDKGDKKGEGEEKSEGKEKGEGEENGEGESKEKGDKKDGGEKGEPKDDGEQGDSAEEKMDSEQTEETDADGQAKADEDTRNTSLQDADLTEQDIGNEAFGESKKEVTVDAKDLINALKQKYNTTDLKERFRVQTNLVATIKGFNQSELGDFYSKIGLPSDLPKSDFLELVKTNTKTLF